MTVDTAKIMEYAATIRWVSKLFSSPKISWAVTKENIQEIDVGFERISKLNNSLKPKWFAWTVRRALALSRLHMPFLILT